MIIKIISAVVNAITKEVHSRTGRINLYGDIFIGLIIALQIVSSGIETIARIIACAVRGLPIPTDNTVIIFELLTLLIAFGICLFFIYHTIKIEKMAKNLNNTKK